MVKVLDFGLAKALEGDAGSDPSQSPTMTAAATRAGVIMGTAAYMSPEQARGSVADRRADIWAFGVVLLEMLTGKETFVGRTVSDTLAFVLTKEPDWSALPPNTSPPIRRLLRRCLSKERRQRLGYIGDARIEIDEALTTPSTDIAAAVPVTPQPVGWRRAMPLATLVVGSLITGLAVWTLTPQPTRPLARFVVSTPAIEPFSSGEGSPQQARAREMEIGREPA